MPVTLWHNPACGTSRNTLAIIRNAGIEPTIVDYLTTPPTRAELIAAIAAAGLDVRAAIRQKGTPYAALGLDDPALSDDQLIDAMLRDPILINRPFVFTPWGVRLSRPSETVLDILPLPQKGPLAKEDGAPLIDAQGQRVR
ncbi:arsenate reductase (glutaredoxin) [Xanthobacter sp. VTT E-85238]